ncbi:efflux RND transporter periplasmic adaptor subunit [Lysobacter koreensis]|uniref:Efflux RND transporter periplasmic adaptor subunit n=1 Tax=Lysobacter koreensis TaxID=266122 RepID=A0ABW2YNP3_9GAMM
MSIRPRTGALFSITATAALLAGCGAPPEVVEAARPVLVAHPVAAGDSVAAYAGEVRAREESPLAFRVGGHLVERKVDVGDHVRRGDLLAVLDAGDLQAQARAAQAQLAAAQAELGRARADQARYATLGREQLVSRSTIDAQNAAAAAAQGQVNAARANLDVASNQSAYTQLRAPSAGVIAARSAEAGQVVGAGQTVFTLASDGAREVAFAVSESAIATLKPGASVLVEVWSQPGQRWPGRVREIAPAADPASRTYAARVTVAAPAGTFELGQSARVYLPQAGNGGLSVPLAALQRSGNGAAVFVVDPATSTLKLQPVQVGPYGQDRAPVKGGLDANDWVVAAGGHLLRAGQKVVPVDRDNRPIKTQ